MKVSVSCSPEPFLSHFFPGLWCLQQLMEAWHVGTQAPEVLPHCSTGPPLKHSFFLAAALLAYLLNTTKLQRSQDYYITHILKSIQKDLLQLKSPFFPLVLGHKVKYDIPTSLKCDYLKYRRLVCLYSGPRISLPSLTLTFLVSMTDFLKLCLH